VPTPTGELRAWLGARAGSFFLLIDEGPGLSGSSFCGTAALLGGLGVPIERIVLFPSHAPDPAAFRSQEARERWPRYPMFHVAFEEVVQDVATWPPGSPELSVGGWRSLFYRDGIVQPAVLGAQERRKYLGPGPVLHKFAGLGRYGAQARERANRLAAVGFVPAVQGLQHGFTQQSFVASRPLGRGDGEGRFLRFAARYLGHLGRTFATGEPARPESLLPMLVANATEALGEGAVPPGFERHAGSLPPAPAVALDGRVLPHEWLRTGHGYLKTDATDHHRDHGYPGLADVAWDVAGVLAEFDLTEAAAGEFVAAVSEALGDPWLPRRLPFHAAAYLAYRTGHAAFAATALGAAPDGLRMRRARDRYRTLLASSLARL
jgi:hypothetical protein